MALFPKVKLKTLPAFPSTINGGAGIDVTRLNGALTVELDWSEFGAISAIPTSPTSYVLTYDTASGVYILVPSHLLGGASSGIADAPIDGTPYARESAAWVPAANGMFLQAGTAAVTRTTQDKLRERASFADFGAKGDGKFGTDGAISGVAFTSASAGFAAGDVGKLIRIAGAGPGGSALETTIAAFASANSVSVSTAAAAAVSGRNFVFGSDDTSAIQAAVNALSANAFSVLRIPGKVFLTSAAINTYTGVAIVGDKRRSPVDNAGSFIVPSTSTDGITIQSADSFDLRDISIVYVGTASGGTCGIRVTPPPGQYNYHSGISSVAIAGAYDAVVLNRCVSALIDWLRVDTYERYGVSMSSNGIGGGDNGDNKLSNSVFLGGPSAFAGCSWDSGGGLTIFNCKFLSGQYGAVFSSATGTNTSQLNVIGNSFDGMTSGNLSFNRQDTSSHVTGVVIGNNTFNMWTGAPNGLVIGPGFSTITITGNTFYGPPLGPSTVIDIDTIDNAIITGNAFISNNSQTNGILILGGSTNVIKANNSYSGTFNLGGSEVAGSVDHDYDVNATVQVTSIPGSVNFISTAGYHALGDGGGALYRRVGSQPAHAGKIQSADGAWWEFCDSAINVHQFGARGDGSTDDSAAINNAIAYMKLPGGNAYPILHFGHPTLFQYVIAHTLNFTGMRDLRTTIDFENSVLLGQCTGHPIMDALDSHLMEFKNGFIFGDPTLIPSHGLQMGVAITNNGADYCRLDNMLFTGNYSYCAFLNAGCELFRAVKCTFSNFYNYADCVIQDGRNASHVSSQFFTATAAHDTYISFQDNEFDGCTFEQDGQASDKTGCAVRIFGNTHSHRFLNGFAQCNYGSAFILLYDHYSMTLDVHCEVNFLVNNVLLVSDPAPMILYGFRLIESFNFATNGVISSDGSGNVIDFVNSEVEIGTSIPNAPVFGPGGRVNFHGKIRLGPNPALYNLGNLNALTGDLELRLPQSTLVLPALRSVRAVSHDTVSTTYYGIHTFVT